jgi:protein-tyrosine phosphatase
MRNLKERPKVLLVCTANICRSPMAEGILRRACARTGLDFDVDSAATHGYRVGERAFPLAIAVARRRGCDITRSVARTIRPHDFRYFDLILAMDRDNVAALRAKAPRQCRHKIGLLLEYGDMYRDCAVPDPFGADIFAYELAFDIIEDGCLGLVRWYLRKREFLKQATEFAA